MQQLAGTGDGFTREPRRQIGRQPGCNAGFGHRLRQQENIGRTGAGQRRDRVHQRLVAGPFDLADGGKQVAGEFVLARRDLGVGDRDADAAADGGRCVRHGAHDGRARRQRLLQKADGAAGHDREHQRGLAHVRPERRQCGGRALRLHRDHDRGGLNRLAFRIELEPAPRQRLHGVARLRFDHHQLLQIEPARDPAVEHGAAHLAGADQEEAAYRFQRLRFAAHASPEVSNMAASSASRAPLPAQTTNWKAVK